MFTTLLNAFKQTNAERGVLVRNQGEAIKETVDAIKNRSNDEAAMTQIVEALNKGTLFTKGFLLQDATNKAKYVRSTTMEVQDSFQQMQMDNALTRKLKGVDDRKLGTNKLLKMDVSDEKKVKQTNEVVIDDAEFQAKTEIDKSEMSKIVLP